MASVVTGSGTADFQVLRRAVALEGVEGIN